MRSVNSVPATVVGFVALLAAARVVAEVTEWPQTIQRVSPAIVTILVDHPRAFDGEPYTTTQGTGFVVDADSGLILTNRHVVGPGPSTARAIFLNREEVGLEPVYRDPVHDFGFFRYDPSKLESMTVEELNLAPDGARVGREIRVIGNDAGDRLSILASTIARLDRRAPDYGRGRYNDFNTFYIQAASGASGGSSGSPVVDIEGRVVALNAGGKARTMSGYYLPLNRVERALDLILRNKPISRGTLQTTFVFESFAELRRLGLTLETNTRVRNAFPDQTGMLVVERVIAESPAADRFAVGDILLEVAGRTVLNFTELADVLDASVGRTLVVKLERNGRELSTELPVTDLHAITPREYLTVGEAILHPLSYQQARHFGRAMRGIFVAGTGYLLEAANIDRHSVITAIDGETTDDLDQLESVLASIPEGAAVGVRWVARDEPLRERFTVARFNRNWAVSRRCGIHASSRWTCRALKEPVAARSVEPRSALYRDAGTRQANRAARSLVQVDVVIPIDGVDGVWERRRQGTGVVVDTGRGWVVTSRAVVPHAAVDVRVTFAGSLEIAGSVEYIHPLHNLAVVSYDPAAVGSTALRSAEFNPLPVAPGDSLHFAGFGAADTLLYRPVQVESVEAMDFEAHEEQPRVFRDFNIDIVSLSDAPEDATGVLLDRRGRTVAMWLSWYGFKQNVHGGVAAELVMEMLDQLRTGTPVRSAEVFWKPVTLSDAREFQVPKEWIERYERESGKRRHLLSVFRIVPGTPAALALAEGDLLLAIDGRTVNSFRDVERLSQRPSLKLTVLRDGQVLALNVDTVAFDHRGLDRMVFWAGALLLAPYRAVLVEQGIEPVGVFSSLYYWGSPAGRERLANFRLVEVNGRPVQDLGSFVDAVKGLPGDAQVRVKALGQFGQPSMVTMKLDGNFWPLRELRRGTEGWEAVDLQ